MNHFSVSPERDERRGYWIETSSDEDKIPGKGHATKNWRIRIRGFQFIWSVSSLMNIVPHHNAWMHGSHNFSIKSDLVGAAQWCVYERPFVNMHILSNEEAPNVSIDQWKSFFSLLTQTGLWVKWSNCPFYQPSPPLILSLPHFTHPTTDSGWASVSQSPSFHTHLHTLWFLSEIKL